MNNTSIPCVPRTDLPTDVSLEVELPAGRRRTQHRSEKIMDEHLRRNAIVYVRQSTQHQVLEHRESTARQYALADRAVALGWPSAAVEIIDEDQGRSGSSAEGRGGYQRLLAEVSSDRVGIIRKGALVVVEEVATLKHKALRKLEMRFARFRIRPS